MEPTVLAATNLDTLVKILGGGLSAIAGGWLTGVLARRRIVQRHVRAITQELELLKAVAEEILVLVEADIAVSQRDQHVSRTIRRLPLAANEAASATGAFDHLAQSDASEKIRALLVVAQAGNAAIAHREAMVSSVGLYQPQARAKISTNILDLVRAAVAAATDVERSLAQLGPVEGGGARGLRLSDRAHFTARR